VVADKADFLYPGEIPTHDLEWYSGPLRYEEWKRLRSPLRSLAIQQGLLSLDMVKNGGSSSTPTLGWQAVWTARMPSSRAG